MTADRGKPFLLLGVIGLLVCAGCWHQAAMKTVSEAVQEGQQQRATAADSYGQVAGPRPTPEAHTSASAAASAPANLQELILHALEHNPEIQASEHTARAKANRVAQATSLADPLLSTKTMPTPLMLADGNQVFILGIDQDLPVPMKLDRRGQVAMDELRMALHDLRGVQQRVIADVKRAYFELFVIDRSTDLALENKEIVKGLLDVARGQYAAGKRDQQDVLRAQVELASLDGDLIELRQRRTTTLAMLNSLLDRPGGTHVDTPGGYDLRRVRARVEDLLATAADVSPELGRLQEQIQRDEAAVELAKLAYWPDFKVGVEWMAMEPRRPFIPLPDPDTGKRDPVDFMPSSGTDMWAITVAINLPVWFEKIEAGIREARHTLSASRQEYAAAKNQIAYRVRDAMARVRSQRELAELFAGTIIPQAKQTYDVSLAGYTAGTSDFEFLIDNWQKWLAFRTQYYRALGELERSVADLEQATGVSMVDIDSIGPPDSQETQHGA
ncbi:MAG TPA: TolC family protein [Phycisphaerae bacterium]|nr:TolC family protein [Phycisphaerae bacterium]